jgi:hypothetical protein
MLTKGASVKTKIRSKRDGNKRNQKWLTNEATIKTKKIHQKTNQTISKNRSKEKQISKRKINRKRRKTNETKKCLPKETSIKTKSIKKWKKAKRLIE